MKTLQKLKPRQLMAVSLMLFGMFFGAGNLIFPSFMGWQSGSNFIPAVLGFIISGVTLPLLGVIAIGITKSDGLLDLGNKVGKGYSYFITILLYLTIGPLYAIPRCATVPYDIGIRSILGSAGESKAALPVYTFIFFVLVFFLSFKRGKLLLWIGKVLTPAFLIFLTALVIAAIVNPVSSASDVAPTGDYADKAFTAGLLAGYDTLDALAALAFGIVVVNTLKQDYKVKDSDSIAMNTAYAGIFSCLFMAVIYVFITLLGVLSFTAGTDAVASKADVLPFAAKHYFGDLGLWFIAITVFLACLKTAVGLVSSCSETFDNMTGNKLGYRIWVAIFCVAAFLVANLGLDTILSYSAPLLYFIYPLAIVLILLALFGKLFGHDKIIYRYVTGFTFIAAVLDFLKTLTATVPSTGKALSGIVDFATMYLPFYSYGFGWILPAFIGLAIGFTIRIIKKKKAAV